MVELSLDVALYTPRISDETLCGKSSVEGFNSDDKVELEGPVIVELIDAGVGIALELWVKEG